jgi:SSS family solute:Na+ symporter
MLAYFIPSVIEIWYTIGSLFIPGIILPVVSAYYPKLRVSNKIILVEMIGAFLFSMIWYFVRSEIDTSTYFIELEPMIVGLFVAICVHLLGMILKE